MRVDAVDLIEEGRAQFREFVAGGVPDDLAFRVAAMGSAFGFLEMAGVALRTGATIATVAALSKAFAEQLDLSWLEQRIVALPRDDYWETTARSSLRDEFFRYHAELPAALLGSPAWDSASEASEAVEQWLVDNFVAAERCRSTFADIEAAGVHDLARVSVAVRALGQLCGSH